MLLFTSYVWGTRHAGMNAQRVTNAVSCIHRSLGLTQSCIHRHDGCEPNCIHLISELKSDTDTDTETDSSANAEPSVDISSFNTPFNILNYSDDFGGIEASFSRATLSFNVLGSLLSELGLSEASDKAVPPCQILTYLGIEFDTTTLEMRIDLTKCDELKSELNRWFRKTVAKKSELQSILGKLLWVSKAVKYSRCFVLRIIAELKKTQISVSKNYS